MALVLVLCLAARGQGEGGVKEEKQTNATRPGEVPIAEIISLIEQLGDEQYSRREEAQQKLSEMADARVLNALREAAAGADPEIAARAKKLMAELQSFSHVVVDAQGRPIAGATVRLLYPKGQKPVTLKSNGFGGVTLPTEEVTKAVRPHFGDVTRPEEAVVPTELRVSHPRFGEAVGGFPLPLSVDENGRVEQAVPLKIRVPLVEKGTEAYGRSLRGVVTGPDGRPMEGARVTCYTVRTPGEGLIQSHDSIHDVLTGAQGRFSIYVSDANPRNERGKLIPERSQFQVVVNGAGEGANADLFPYAASFPNAEEAKIRLPRPELSHQFAYEAPPPGGGRLGKDDLPNLWIAYTQPDGTRVSLPKKYREGGKLLPGTYTAEWADMRGKRIVYQPVEVKADSPEVLLFRLPSPVHYRGHVVDGRDGKPLGGVFVMGKTGTMKDNPALLTDDQWTELEALPAKPAMDDDRLKALSRIYAFETIVRTDENGEFDVEQPIDHKYYDVAAIARGRLAYAIKVYKYAGGEKPEVAMGDMPLFPAARVTLKIMPAPGSRHMSVMPEWILAADHQPEWFEHFKRVMGNRPYGSEAFIPYGQWLKPNKAEMEPILVPADVKLTLKFGVPYEEGLVPTVYEKPIQLAAGKVLDIGEVAFKPAMVVKVKVVNEAGKGVEGVAVREKYEDENIWSVVHNADQEGFVRFFVRPNSSVEFAPDTMAATKEEYANRPRVAFKVGATAPAEALVITLTPQQIQTLTKTAGKPGNK